MDDEVKPNRRTTQAWMRNHRVAIIGAGVGGLAAAIDLARQGFAVTVLERAAIPGGKMRTERVGTAEVDCGPTVFTMRWIFDALFAAAGTTMESRLSLQAADVLARHAWNDAAHLDLFADLDRSVDAVGNFAGATEAAGYRSFANRAQRIFESLDAPFMRAEKPTPFSLAAAGGIGGLGRLWDLSPFTTLWRALGEHFRDPRLRQLFGRYATYSGSSPFLAPATLMLIAHAERLGVWRIEGGMRSLARALADLAIEQGATIRYDAEVSRLRVERNRVAGVELLSGEHLAVDAVIANVDSTALSAGLFGTEAARAVPATNAPRSFSALTFCTLAETSGFPLSHHSVFFSADYEAEFQALMQGSMPVEATVYICAQDRGDDQARVSGPERLFFILNAPAHTNALGPTEIAECETRMTNLLQRCGLTLHPSPEPVIATTPAIFGSRFPATDGALYGPALHHPTAAFRRPTARTRLTGLYLAGGSVHPGPGVPMAALSGRTAASCLVADSTSTSVWHRTAMFGGTSTR